MRMIQAAGLSTSPAFNASAEVVAFTVLRYRAGDPITSGACRSQIVCDVVRKNTPVSWKLSLSFGGIAPGDAWESRPEGECPVLFWELKTMTQGNPAIAFIVDTDPADPSKLTIFVARRTAGMSLPERVGALSGITKSQLHTIAIDAVLSAGADGRFKVVVDDRLLAEFSGPTLVDDSDHSWYQNVYMYKYLAPCAITRAIYWQEARLIE